MRKVYLTYLLIALPFGLFAQSALGLKISTISLHPIQWDQDPVIFENKLVKDGSVTADLGYQISYQKFIYLTVLSLELRQGIHADAAGLMAGHFAADLRWKFFHKGRSALSLSFGPVYAIRQHWDAYGKYVDDGIYNNKNDFQDKWLWGGELEYAIYIANRHDLTISLSYNNSYNTINLALGYRFWVNPFVNMADKKKCISCSNKWSKGRFRKWWRKVWR